VAVTLVATVTTPKSTRPRQKMDEEGGGMHDNRGVKEEVRRWRMLMTTMMVVVGHDDGDKRQSTKQCESGVDIDCGCDLQTAASGLGDKMMPPPLHLEYSINKSVDLPYISYVASVCMCSQIFIPAIS
jgi:hypothetical protein